MIDLLALAAQVNIVGLPTIGLFLVIASKLVRGSIAATIDRLLLSVFMLVILSTVHAMLTEDRSWMVHALTVGTMLLGVVWEPKPSKAV